MEFSPKQEKENAKYCALEIKELSQKNNQLLLEITLHTGRKHQIRSILAYFGYPIVGDRKYSSKVMLSNKIYLLAYKIIFNNLPAPLSYLNGQEFCLEKLESKFRKNTL
jgi:23S rRNA pseudouridine955/2504/2580 synthase